MRIGRQSVSRGIMPEIDLRGPPADPGISRLHAILLARPDGSWAVADPGSENGTKVNDVEIATDVPVPLADGDCIFLGAWTAITIARQGRSDRQLSHLDCCPAGSLPCPPLRSPACPSSSRDGHTIAGHGRFWPSCRTKTMGHRLGNSDISGPSYLLESGCWRGTSE